MLRNEDALTHLLESLSDARGMSSHWQHYHQSFAVEGEGAFHVEGIEGYTPHVAWKAPLHRLLQREFIAMGRPFALFPTALDAARSMVGKWRAQLDLGLIRQTLTLACVNQQVPLGSTLHLVIGDGFGGLGSLILAVVPGSRVLFVNLTKSLLLDLHYCRLAQPGLSMALVSNAEEMAQAVADASVRVIGLKAGEASLLSLAPVAVAFNVASMQEMDLAVVGEYFRFMRQCAAPPLFYCCNRVEKRLPDGSLIRFQEYPWLTGDRILLDELCPWHQEFYTLRPPFRKRYDGPIQHRLVQLAPP